MHMHRIPKKWVFRFSNSTSALYVSLLRAWRRNFMTSSLTRPANLISLRQLLVADILWPRVNLIRDPTAKIQSGNFLRTCWNMQETSTSFYKAITSTMDRGSIALSSIKVSYRVICLLDQLQYTGVLTRNVHSISAIMFIFSASMCPTDSFSSALTNAFFCITFRLCNSGTWNSERHDLQRHKLWRSKALLLRSSKQRDS